jgi:nucleoside-diphosphate-sugar epimerase
MRLTPRTILVTGVTGLIGGDVLARLLGRDPALRAIALVRDLGRWGIAAARHRLPAERVVPVVGDLRVPGLALEPAARRRLLLGVTDVLHCAADTSFSRTLDDARAINTAGTGHLLELTADCPGARRFTFVSTAFVAGCLTGPVPEDRDAAGAGWVNAYEQSKYEAERLVRAHAADWLILRPSTVVCESAAGTVRQVNAVHRALRLYHHGLASMMPGTETSTVDVVTTGYVAGAIAALAMRDDLSGRAVHLCAGAGGLPLGELLDLTYRVWSRDPAWRRRGIPRPAITDLETYRLFEQAVHDTGDERLRQVVRSLSHFTPQLALPKAFDTSFADAVLGERAPAVAGYWTRMLEYLLENKWAAPARAAA